MKKDEAGVPLQIEYEGKVYNLEGSDLEKKGAKHSKATMASLQTIHKAHKALHKMHKDAADHHETIHEHMGKLLELGVQTGSTKEGETEEHEASAGSQRKKAVSTEGEDSLEKRAADGDEVAKELLELREFAKGLKEILAGLKPEQTKVARTELPDGIRVVTKRQDMGSAVASGSEGENSSEVKTITKTNGDSDLDSANLKKVRESIYSAPIMGDMPVAAALRKTGSQ